MRNALNYRVSASFYSFLETIYPHIGFKIYIALLKIHSPDRYYKIQTTKSEVLLHL